MVPFVSPKAAVFLARTHAQYHVPRHEFPLLLNVHRNAVFLTFNSPSLCYRLCLERGVNFRALGELFALSAQDKAKEFQFRVSMLEVNGIVHLHVTSAVVINCIQIVFRFFSVVVFWENIFDFVMAMS